MEYTESNKLIAEFMGAKPRKPSSWGRYYEFYDDDGLIRREVREDSMLYHTSWGWLMPVVEKIGDSRFDDYMFRIEIVNGYTKIEGTGQRIFSNSSVEGSMLLATYKAVLQFIQWFNQQSK